jgi:uncharacterized protein YegL
MTKPEEFTVSEARPLPVILLLDSSGSMEGDKINILNAAVREMLQSFASEDDISAAIHVGVIQFGRTVGWHQPLLPVEDVINQWSDLEASGKTPLGQGLTLLRESLDDRSVISSRAYRPTIVLVSDGKPTDDWGGPMEELQASPRASKVARFAMGIGADADLVVLSGFIGTASGSRVFEAHEASRIQKFFRFVTMSVTM